MNPEIKTMRDVFIGQIYNRMRIDKNIFFLCADFGSPKLDLLRVEFKNRFINVGIAEQNLVNVATGLALEGFTVYAYAIAPFLTMRAFEQIRINLSLQAQLRQVNVNLIGVGAGLSYDVSGPTHHCLEDISIIRSLPNITFFSPSDWVLAKDFFDYTVRVKEPKYLRFDSKPLESIYKDKIKPCIEQGFHELLKGKRLCIVSTGYFTHMALKIADMLSREGIHIGVIDVFLLKPFNAGPFLDKLKGYKTVITMEEGFIDKGGLDSLVSSVLGRNLPEIRLKRMGFNDSYVFTIGPRHHLYELVDLSEESIAGKIKEFLENERRR